MDKFYKTVISIEILSDELYPDCVTLEQINYDITEGHCSGRLLTEVHNEELTKEQMAEALIAQGSDPSFLIGEDTE
jgi:hypothetical protein